MTGTIDIRLCVALLREFLSGYRGYPYNEAGENRFGGAIRDNCISVDHARATLESFDEDFPTVRMIHDAAISLRTKFEPQVDQQAEWRKEFGAAQPFRVPSDELSMHWQSFRDALYYTEGPGAAGKRGGYWEGVAMSNQSAHPQSIAWVRHLIAGIGWTVAMRQEECPSGMPYVRPPWSTRHTPKSALKSISPDIANAPEPPPRRAVGLLDAPEQSPDSMADDSWDDPDR